MSRLKTACFTYYRRSFQLLDVRRRNFLQRSSLSPSTKMYILMRISRRWQARPPFCAIHQLGQLALIGILFCQITSRLSEYPHLIFSIPGRIEIVSRDFFNFYLETCQHSNNDKTPKSKWPYSGPEKSMLKLT